MTLQLRTFRPGEREKRYFRLNEAWIRNDFTLEEEDRQMLSDPQTRKF